MSIRTYIKKDDYDLLHFQILNAIYAGAKTCRTIDDIIATSFKDSEDYVKIIITEALTKCKNYTFALSKLECDGIEYDALNELLKIETEPDQEKKKKMEGMGLKHDIDFMPDEFFYVDTENKGKRNEIDDPYSTAFEYLKKKKRITSNSIRRQELKMKKKPKEGESKSKMKTVNLDKTGTIMDFILVAANNTRTYGKLTPERSDEILTQFSSQKFKLDGIDDMDKRIEAMDRAILEFKDNEFYPIIMVMIILLKYWKTVKLLEPNAETNPGGFIYSSIAKIWLEFLEFFIEGARNPNYVTNLTTEKKKMETKLKEILEFYNFIAKPRLLKNPLKVAKFIYKGRSKILEYYTKLIEELPRFNEINLIQLGLVNKETENGDSFWSFEDLKKLYPIIIDFYKTEIQKHEEKIKFAGKNWRWDKNLGFNINVKKLLFKMVHVYYEIYDVMLTFENIDPNKEIRKRKQSHYLSFDFANFKSKHLRHLLALVEANVLYKDVKEFRFKNYIPVADEKDVINEFLPRQVLDIEKIESETKHREVKKKYFDYFDTPDKYNSDVFEYIEFDLPETEYENFLKKPESEWFGAQIWGFLKSQFKETVEQYKYIFNELTSMSVKKFFKPEFDDDDLDVFKRSKELKGRFGSRSLFLTPKHVENIIKEPNEGFNVPLTENALLYDAILCHMNKMKLMKGVGYFNLYFLPLYVIMKICMENRLDTKNLGIPMSSEFFFSEKKIINPTTLTPLLSKRNSIRPKFVEDTTVGVAGIMNFYLVYDEETKKKLEAYDFYKTMKPDIIKIRKLYENYDKKQGYFYWIIKRFNELLTKKGNKITVKKYREEMKRHFRVFANENIKHNAPFLASSNLTIVGKLEERITENETVLLREYEDYDFKKAVPPQNQNIEKGFSDYSNYISRFIHDFSRLENINLLLLAQVILYFYNINTDESDNIFKELAWFFISVKKREMGYEAHYKVGCPIIGKHDDYGDNFIFGTVKEYDSGSKTYTINPYYHNEKKQLRHLDKLSDGLVRILPGVKPIVNGYKFPIFWNPLLVPLHDPLKYVKTGFMFTENEFSYVNIREVEKFKLSTYIKEEEKKTKKE